MRVFLTVFLLYLCGVLSLASENISAGLYFLSHSVIKEDRTSLYLNPDGKFNLSDGFTLDFDINLRLEEHNFGYIFRIIADDEKSFDLISNISNTRRTLRLIESDKLFLSFDQDSLIDYHTGEWTHVRLVYTPQKIDLTFNGKTLSTPCHYEGLKNFEFYFGYTSDEDFISWDLPPMSIRNIQISNNKQEIIADWPLREHGEFDVYDIVKERRASVINPIWEADKHIKWVREQKLILPIYTQIAYDNVHHYIYLANSTALIRYNTTTNLLDTLLVQKGNPYVERNNQMLYNPYYDELWSYDFDKERLSIFNFETKEWSEADLEVKNPDFSQHNAFISPVDSALYTIAGYGNYIFKNSLHRKGRNDGRWETIQYEIPILPRSLSGLGFKDDRCVLILGGHGNSTGEQELGTRIYHDLYEMDIQTHVTKKLWEFENSDDDFIVGNSIVVDEKSNKIYALCFPIKYSNNAIVLRSFDITTGEQEIYADSIHYVFDDVNSFCTLYQNKENSKIYALVANNYQNSTNVDIYSLSFPPSNINAVYVKASQSLLSGKVLLIMGVLLVVLSVSFILYKLRKKRNASVNTDIILSANKEDDKEDELGASVQDYYLSKGVHHKSAVLFLGGFQIWNKNGENITKNFTSVVKQLLILIILYGQKNKKGISNTILKDILWFDKTEESAQNNRRVNIHKLKVLLDEIDGVELIKHHNYWSIEFSEGGYCDYVESNLLLDKINESKKITESDIKGFPLDLLSEELLPFTQSEWLDAFKSDYSNKILDATISLSKQKAVKTNNNLLIHIANIMFAHDKTDEHALHLKCRVLMESGKISMAKNTYDIFCTEYKNLLGIDYPKDFKEICLPDDNKGSI